MRRWLSREAIPLHLAVVVFVPACAVLTWWQVGRALSGNTLSWAYSFEWPVFAGFAVFMWWKLLHESPERADDAPVHPPARTPPPSPQPAAVDEEMDAYNRWLASLAASGKRKSWRS